MVWTYEMNLLLTKRVVKFCAVVVSSWFSVTSRVWNGLNTGFGKIQRKRDASPLSTLFLSTIRGIAVDGCVIPQNVKHVRGMLKFALPATEEIKNVKCYLQQNFMHFLNIKGQIQWWNCVKYSIQGIWQDAVVRIRMFNSPTTYIHTYIYFNYPRTYRVAL